jgi:hypothetical protein
VLALLMSGTLPTVSVAAVVITVLTRLVNTVPVSAVGSGRREGVRR